MVPILFLTELFTAIWQLKNNSSLIESIEIIKKLN